jgi:hypothetical protein
MRLPGVGPHPGVDADIAAPLGDRHAHVAVNPDVRLLETFPAAAAAAATADGMPDGGGGDDPKGG